jgi:hypothetical protein
VNAETITVISSSPNCKDEFSERMGFYEPNMEEYCEAVQELEENGPPEDAWANLAPQTEQQSIFLPYL